MDTVQNAFAPEGANVITMEYLTKDHPYGKPPAPKPFNTTVFPF